MALGYGTREVTRDVDAYMSHSLYSTNRTVFGNETGSLARPSDIDDAQTLLKALAGSFDVIWNDVKDYVPKGWELKSKLAFEVLWEANQ